MSQIKRSRHRHRKRVRENGSSWSHTLVNCDEVMDVDGGLHYPMLDIYVKYLEHTTPSDMTAHVRHLAKNERTQVYTDGEAASKCISKSWRHGVVNHKKE